MSSLQDIVDKYTVRYDAKLRSICAPLQDCLGIHTFLYYYLDASGHIAVLSNYPEWLDYYYTQEYYLTNPYLVHPGLIQSGYVFTSTTTDKWYLKEYHASKSMYEVRNPFLIVDCKNDTCEGFLFSAKHIDHISIYLEHLELLRKFTQYFKKEAYFLIEKVKHDKYSLAQAKGNNFYKRDAHLPLQAHSNAAEKFLKAISPLSTRERECLELFRQGHSAQATAARLNLSRRTVESHFENIKNKLHCYSKWDLLGVG